MGDHTIGHAMGRAADVWWKERKASARSIPGTAAEGIALTPKAALATLDRICMPYRGRDAEFEAEDPRRKGYVHPRYDDYTDPDGPIGRLIVVAFRATLEEMALDDGEPNRCPWMDGPYERFRKRYGFC